MKNNIYLGFDISTTCIGISMFDENGGLLHINHLVMKTDDDVLPEHRIYAKANLFKEFITIYKEYNILDIFIEEPLIASNNQYTSNLLMKFNGICSYMLYTDLLVLPKHKSVHEIRKILCPELLNFKTVKGQIKVTLSFPKEMKGKDYIFNKMQMIYSDINWVYDKKGKLSKFNYDMSDAIAVGRAFLIENELIKH
jgi:hypothetical protein